MEVSDFLKKINLGVHTKSRLDSRFIDKRIVFKIIEKRLVCGYNGNGIHIEKICRKCKLVKELKLEWKMLQLGYGENIRK